MKALELLKLAQVTLQFGCAGNEGHSFAISILLQNLGSVYFLDQF